jgi:isopenicillin-N N-acyltransferase-like protein
MINEGLFPIIEVEGTPFEIGKAYAERIKPQIDISMDTYKAMFQDFSNISWDSAKKYAKKFIPVITEFDADIMEEIRGVAEGSGYAVEDILALNVRSEIVLQGGLIDGCTSFALTPQITEGRESWIAQNWDWKIQQRRAYVLLRIRQKNKPDIDLFTEAGIVGKLGFNSAGLGVCLNALASDYKLDEPCVPLHIVLRSILNSPTLSDAIFNIAKMPLACCANFLMGHSNGEAISVEVAPGDFDVIYADEGWAAHTNHFTSLRLARFRDTGKKSFPDTFLRYGRVRQLLRGYTRPIGLPDIKEMLRDHTDFPDGICRHENPRDIPGKRMGTVFSIIMNLSRREMYITPGNPCQTPYHLYKL